MFLIIFIYFLVYKIFLHKRTPMGGGGGGGCYFLLQFLEKVKLFSFFYCFRNNFRFIKHKFQKNLLCKNFRIQVSKYSKNDYLLPKYSTMKQ